VTTGVDAATRSHEHEHDMLDDDDDGVVKHRKQASQNEDGEKRIRKSREWKERVLCGSR
jgi:hypothetical protein